MIHELKTHPGPFQAVLDGDKLFEFRKNDRNFNVGDELFLQEFEAGPPDHGPDYTGRGIVVRVLYLVRGPDYGVPDGYCVMSILLTEDMGWGDAAKRN